MFPGGRLAEDVSAGPEENGVAQARFAAASGKHARNGDRSAQRRMIMKIASLQTGAASANRPPARRRAGLAGRDGDLRLAIIVIEMKGDHTIEQGVLRAIQRRRIPWGSR